MFSLIISIIAIALVAALALASIYYGGDAFQRGSADAEASTIVNQGQQIQAAVTMADVDEKTLPVNNATITTWVGEADGGKDYLKEAPKVRGKDWTAVVADGAASYVKIDVNSVDVCKAVNKKFNGEETSVAVNTQAFGCTEGTGVGEAATASVAFYRL